MKLLRSDGFKLIIDAIGPDAQNSIEDDAALIDEEDSIREEGDDEDDCDWISCKDEVEIREGIEYSYIGKIFHDKAKKEADGSPNPFATGTVVDIMRIVDEKDLYLFVLQVQVLQLQP